MSGWVGTGEAVQADMCKQAVGETAFITCEFVESPTQLNHFPVIVHQYRQTRLLDAASSPPRLKASMISTQKRVFRHQLSQLSGCDQRAGMFCMGIRKTHTTVCPATFALPVKHSLYNALSISPHSQDFERDILRQNCAS